MVRVKMSEKETVYLSRANSSPSRDGFAVANLGQANYDIAAAVKQQLLAGHFDKNGRAESLRIREGSSCTEQRNSHPVGARGNRNAVYQAQRKEQDN